MEIIHMPSPDHALTATSTIKDVLIAITNNQRGSLVVVGEGDVYMGVVSDGDVRRAMVQGATEFTPVEKCVNTNGRYVTEDVTEEAMQAIFEEHPEVMMLPVLNTQNKVVSVVTR